MQAVSPAVACGNTSSNSNTLVVLLLQAHSNTTSCCNTTSLQQQLVVLLQNVDCLGPLTGSQGEEKKVVTTSVQAEEAADVVHQHVERGESRGRCKVEDS